MYLQTKKLSSLAERDILCDQRSDRRMVISGLGKAATILNKKETNGGWKELNSFIIYLCVVKLSAHQQSSNVM